MSAFSELKNKLKSDQHQWLLTGCAGFIGSHLLETLLNLNQKVVGLDNLATGSVKNIEQVLASVSSEQRNNFKFLQGDIRDRENLTKAMSGCEYILHQAALGSVPRSFNEPSLFHDVNATGFLNVITLAKEMQIERVVYASSSSVYGSSEKLPKVEHEIGRPLSPYAATKFFNEIHADIHSKHYAQTLVGLRYFNVFGPRQNPNGAYAAVIPKWIAGLLTNQKIEIYGDGETSRDFCFVQNVVQANLLAAFASKEKVAGEVFNIACADRTTLNELFNHINHQLKEKVLGYELQRPLYKDFRAGDIRHSFADISKAQKLLGYKPTHSVKQALEQSLDWYIAQSPTKNSKAA